MQAFLFRVWAEGDQVQGIHWLRSSSASQTDWLLPPHQPGSCQPLVTEPKMGPGASEVSPHNPRGPGELWCDGIRTQYHHLYTMLLGCRASFVTIAEPSLA